MDLLTLVAKLLQFMQLMVSMASGAILRVWIISLLLVDLLMKLVQRLSSLPGLLSNAGQEQRLEAAGSLTTAVTRLEVIQKLPWSLTPSAAAEEETVYVAVGRDVRECSSTMGWAVKNRAGRKIGILHVHQPTNFLPTKKRLQTMQVESYMEKEKKEMHDSLNEYKQICVNSGVQSAKIITDFIEMDNIERGILTLVADHGVTMLVMGAAADKHYSRNMKEPGSRKASVVSKEAPHSCYIWFICDGKLVCARETDIYGNSVYVTPPMQFMKEDAKEQDNMVKQQQQSFRKKQQKAILVAEKKPSSSAEKLAHQVKQAETAYQDELQKRKEIEEMLVQKSRKLKQAEEALHNERQKGKQMEEMLTRENRNKLKQAEAAYHSELQKRKEMEELKVQEISHKLKQALEELQHARDQQATLDQREVADSSQISYAEIMKATQGLHESFKIGQGGYGSVYKGQLRCAPVAIKMLNPMSRQGGSEFQQEMEILSRVRHPNLVILMGTCLEAKALIYEYLPNGSLEDRLLCKHNSPPLSWQIRTRILNQVWPALIYLHSAGLHGIVHGDLKPDNILLDANFVAKLGDFGISRLMRRQVIGSSPSAGSTSTICWETDQPKGTVAYIDPEYMQTGVLRPKSDVYSFGVVILRAITGQRPMQIIKLVKDGDQAGQLDRILDKKAGKWPPVLAKELAKLALRCCETNPRDRPDLNSEVWKVLERMMGAARPAAPAPNGVS